jgi:flagellar motor switch protein FliN/FliY
MATRLIHHLETAFRQTVNSLTGKDFAVSLESGSSAPPMEEAIVWQQSFSAAEGPSLWIAAGKDLWESLGRLTLVAAGLDEATEEDCRSTWEEIINQTVGGVASRITADAQSEVTAAQGQVIGTEPRDLSWASFSVAGNHGAPWFFKAAWTEELSALGEPRVEEARSPAVRDSTVSKTFDLLLDVALPVSVSFGKTVLQIREVLKLSTGSIVELDRLVTDPVEVIVNDCVIARGEVVVVDGNYGVRISQLASREERLRSGMAGSSHKAGARS